MRSILGVLLLLFTTIGEAKQESPYATLKLRLRKDESGGNYKAVNQLGYVGAYQWGCAALQDLRMAKECVKLGNVGLRQDKFWTGRHGVKSLPDFLNNPIVQERLIDEWIKMLYDRIVLNRCIKHIGKQFYGIDITEPGLLAASHLLGAGQVNKGIRLNKNYTDANGTSLRKRLKDYRND